MNTIKKFEKSAKYRVIFLEMLSDKKEYGWRCSKHNCLIGNDVKVCPLCVKEDSTARHAKEIKEKGIYIGTQTPEALKEKYKLDNIKRGERIKWRRKHDEDYKKHLSSLHAKSRLKERNRKFEHAI